MKSSFLSFILFWWWSVEGSVEVVRGPVGRLSVGVRGPVVSVFGLQIAKPFKDGGTYSCAFQAFHTIRFEFLLTKAFISPKRSIPEKKTTTTTTKTRT